MKAERSLRCSAFGCNRPWVTNVEGRRRCVEHQPRKSKQVVPTKPAAPHWQDTDKDKDEE